MFKQPHKHAALIKAWADGAEIQVLNHFNTWETIQIPMWNPMAQYRIKPKPLVKKYLFAFARRDTVSLSTPFWYKDLEEFLQFGQAGPFDWIERIDASVIEVEES